MNDRRLALAVWIAIFGVYAFFFGGTGWNQNSSFALTRAIVEQRTFCIDRYRATTEDVAFVGGHAYSNKMPGAAFLAVPVYAVIHSVERAAGIDVDRPLTAARNQYLCTVAVCATLGALIASLLFLIARRFGATQRWALIIAALVALGTPLFAYSTLFYVHLPNAAFMLLSYFFALGDRRRDVFFCGLFAGCAVLTNYLALPFVMFIAAFAVWRYRSAWPRGIALSLAGAAGPLLLAAWYQTAAFGGIFRNPISKNQMFVSKSAWFGIIEPPSLTALAGITISPYRGLFFVSPILLLSIAGFFVWLRRREQIPTLLFFAATFGLFFGFNVTFNGWRGGNGFGARYLLPIVPFLGVLLIPLRERVRALWAALGGIAILNNLAATAVDPQPLEAIANPLRDYIYPILVNAKPNVPPPPWLAPGRTSVNLDSFNLGEFVFRSGNILSLVPVLVWIMLFTIAFARVTREVHR